ncbi:hypothetical protein BOW37_10395 [Solemya velum gill symbiont]|nr:hypothetical protein BOW37_10395 [Solemya velum gill symbiont]OOZ44622.1 hypothetical protein BOW38_11075 [Solemya velum gill symbiont]OOZ48355.1 hypothetical protein BOW39_10975 [Solemya velum gill symbiont]OOZ49821.1 hypothetical protein BOW40_11150 [Solemya velum gill symbiont]OOZ53178.1 hypothetical protein BOW41_11150 [Solemya velum gill symbiont]
MEAIMNKQWNKPGVVVSFLVLSVAAFPVISVSDNLVENGSFEFPAEEQGGIPGWLQYGSRMLEDEGLPNGAADGEIVVELKKEDAFLQQQLRLPHSGRYEMSTRHMLLREPESSKVAKVRVLWGQEQLARFKASNDNWRSRRFDLVATAGDGELLIERYKDDWAASRLIDDVRLYSTCRVSPNLVRNGSFESNGSIVGAKKPWRLEYGGIHKFDDQVDEQNVAEGGKAAALMAVNEDAHLYQQLKTVLGQRYEVTFELAAAGKEEADASVEFWWGQEKIAVLDAYYHQWSSHTFSLDASRPETRVRLIRRRDGRDVYSLLDDVRVYAVDGTIEIEPFTAVVTPGVEFQYAPTYTSDAAVVKQWSLKDAPDGMTIDAQTGVINWTPDTAEDTSFTLVADAPDCAAHDEQLIQLEGNHNPQFTSAPVLTAVTGTPYVYYLAATDADDDALIYDLELTPSGMVLDVDEGLLYWHGPKIGNHNVIVTVEDGLGGVANQEFVVTVTEP